MSISSGWTSQERCEVARVLSRASYQDKAVERMTPFSWGRMRQMTRLIYTVLNEPALFIEKNRSEIILQYEQSLREQEQQDSGAAVSL